LKFSSTAWNAPKWSLSEQKGLFTRPSIMILKNLLIIMK